MTRVRKQSPYRWLGRYAAGRPLDGYPRTDATWTRSGTKPVGETGRAGTWHMRPGWHRSAFRLCAPLAVALVLMAALTHPAITATGGAGLAVRLVRRWRARWRTRRFRSTYIRPLARALVEQLGIPPHLDPARWLTVSPDLAGLAPVLVRPMTPFELWVRGRYGLHVEPVIRYLPERAMRAYWYGAQYLEPGYRKVAEAFRKPAPEHGPRIEIRVPGYVTEETRKLVRSMVAAKLGLSDLVEHWDQVGPEATGTYTVRVQPRERYGLADMLPVLDGLADHELLAGFGAGDVPTILDLDADSPHIACSGGSGSGKSELAKDIAVQVLRRGGRVLILDRKGSHRWARGLDGVTYCTRPADMHAALIGAASCANARNDRAMEEPEGWIPGPRVLIIFEEMNATFAMLVAYWDSIRGKDDPKLSPAITAFRELMYMGRSAFHHLFGVAQMLSARTTGGPEARENFGIRALARYTANAWKMLAPECAMPRKSKVRGRWQFVISGDAIETQVPLLTEAEARWLATPVTVTVPSQMRPDLRDNGVTVTGDGRYTLADAARQDWCTLNYPALRARMSRARERPKGRGGRYTKDELLTVLEPADSVSGGNR